MQESVLGIPPRASVGKWDTEFAVGVGVGKAKVVTVVEELPGWYRRCILKFYLPYLVVGNGNGRPVRCCLASRVHSKSNISTVSVSQRKRDTKATHTNPVIK